DYVTDKNQNPKNSQLLFMERNIDEGETNEKAMVYVPFSVRWDMKRRRPTERFCAPENYGKSRYLKYSYNKIPMDEKESQLRLLKKERLRDYEIERIMEKRRRIERQ
ncbi:24044_t:CDS:2, partial [Gigaspora rosea]